MNSFLTKSGKMSVLFACVLLLVVSASAQLSLRKALDFDNDNKADFSIFRPTNNTWFIRASSGANANISQAFGSSNTDYQTPGDYDGDNKSDICVWRDTDGVWYRINSSTNTFSGEIGHHAEEHQRLAPFKLGIFVAVIQVKHDVGPAVRGVVTDINSSKRKRTKHQQRKAHQAVTPVKREVNDVSQP